mgnify:CR=1 FL=1
MFTDLMVLNVTYPSRKTKAEIDKLVGPAYSFMDRIKMKGIGSKKMILVDGSESILSLYNDTKDTRYCNIEIRKNGLVVGFRSTLRIYVWLIPFYQLTLYHDGNQLTVYSLQDHMKMKAAFNGSIEKQFLLKMQEEQKPKRLKLLPGKS